MLRGRGHGHGQKREREREREHHRERGVALITVLLVVLLASIAATALAALQQIAVRRSSVLAHQQQARLYTLGAEQWVAQILARDRRANDRDHLGEDWAVAPVLPVAGGSIGGRVVDLQGRFNLNNLVKGVGGVGGGGGGGGGVDAGQLALFQRLLENLQLDPGLAQAIGDWLDADQDAQFPDGAEDAEYLAREPAYLSADQAMADISELRLIRGVDREVYAALAPYVAALPGFTAVNVNTAPAALLAAFADTLGVAEAAELEADGDTYASVEDFLEAAALQDGELNAHNLTVASGYFQLQAQAQVGAARARLVSVLARDEGGAVAVLRRSYGSDP